MTDEQRFSAVSCAVNGIVKNGKPNQIPRLRGELLWHQAYWYLRPDGDTTRMLHGSIQPDPKIPEKILGMPRQAK